MKNIIIPTTTGDVHVKEVIKYINPQEYKVTQVLTDDFPSKKILYTEKGFVIDDISIPEDVFSVWYRKPELWDVDLEGKGIKYGLTMDYKKNENLYIVRGIMYLTNTPNIFQISNLTSINTAKNKLLQFKLAQRIGFNIPPTIVTNKVSKLIEFENRYKPCVIKSFTNEAIYGEYFQSFMTYRLNDGYFFRKYKSKEIILNYTVFLQKEIMKKFDIRVTVIGKKIYSCLIDSQSHPETITDFRVLDMKKLHHEVFKLPSEMEEKCYKLVKELNLQYGAIDFVLDKKNNLIFLEINPNGQYLWIEEQIKLPLSMAMAALLTNPEENKLN